MADEQADDVRSLPGEGEGGRVWTTNPWVTSRGEVETTFPNDLVEFDSLPVAEPLSFRPFLDGTAINFRVETAAEADQPHVRRLKRRTAEESNHNQATLRYPKTLAAAAGLHEAAAESTARTEIERAEAGVYVVRPWPRVRPVAANERLDRDPRYIRPFRVGSSSGVELPGEWAEILGLRRGDQVAYRLTSADGELTLLADVNVTEGDLAGGEGEDSAAHVRRVQAHTSGAEGSQRLQYRLYLPATLLYALGWIGDSLEFTLARDQLLIRRAPDDVDDADVTEKVPSDATDSATA